jgi:small subunit ribosomal protein S14
MAVLGKTNINKRRNNDKRTKMAANKAKRRAELKAIIKNKKTSMEDRFDAVLRLAKMPRNSSSVRQRNRCELTGRPRGTYRKFKLARIMLRDMAGFGKIPGMIKASW